MALDVPNGEWNFADIPRRKYKPSFEESAWAPVTLTLLDVLSKDERLMLTPNQQERYSKDRIQNLKF